MKTKTEELFALQGASHLKSADLLKAGCQLAAAEAEYRDLLRKDCFHHAARFGLAEVLNKRGMHREAAQHVNLVLLYDKDNIDAQLLLVKCLIRIGRLEPAREHYRNVIQQAPERDDPELRIALFNEATNLGKHLE